MTEALVFLPSLLGSPAPSRRTRMLPLVAERNRKNVTTPKKRAGKSQNKEPSTSHVHFSRCLLLPEDAAVLSHILRLDVSDVHLGYVPSELHLVAPSGTQLVFRLEPPHRHASARQLAAQGHAASLWRLLVLQARFEGEGDRWETKYGR